MKRVMLWACLLLSLIFVSGCVENGVRSFDELKDLDDSEWRWVKTVTPIEEFIPPFRENDAYLLQFGKDGNISVIGDPNLGMTEFVYNEYSVDFIIGGTTLMAVPEDSLEYEFFNELNEVVIGTFIDGQLVLEMPMDGGSMIFEYVIR